MIVTKPIMHLNYEPNWWLLGMSIPFPQLFFLSSKILLIFKLASIVLNEQEYTINWSVEWTWPSKFSNLLASPLSLSHMHILQLHNGYSPKKHNVTGESLLRSYSKLPSRDTNTWYKCGDTPNRIIYMNLESIWEYQYRIRSWY